MAGGALWAFWAVWLIGLVASVPAAFALAHVLVRKRIDSHYPRIFAGTVLGFVLAPFALYTAVIAPFAIAAVFLPLTIILMIVLAVWAWFAARRRARRF